MSQLDEKTIAAYFDEVNALLQKTTLTPAERKKAEALVSVLILNPSMANYISQNSDLCSHIQKLADVAVVASHKQYLKRVPMEVFAGDSNTFSFVVEGLEASKLAREAVISSVNVMDVLANSAVAMEAMASSEIIMADIVESVIAMEAIANSNVAMDVIASSSVAALAIKNSSNLRAIEKLSPSASGTSELQISKVFALMAGSDPASVSSLEDVWVNDTIRQSIWTKSASRLLLWLWLDNFDWNGGMAELDSDYTAGFLNKASWGGTGSAPAGWNTQVLKNDGKRYIAFIHYYSYSTYDWTNGEIANADGSDAVQFGGGANTTRYGKKATLSGLRIRFYENDDYRGDAASHAYSWYIAVED